MIQFLFIQKLARVSLKKRFRLAIPGKGDYILTFPHCIKTTRMKLSFPSRHLQKSSASKGKKIANGQTKSHILESEITKDNQQ